MECVQALRGLGVQRCVELGPGKTLAGLIRRIDRGLPVLGLADARSAS
jgi:[acyl-carrier-protein] S-malonyltransferase